MDRACFEPDTSLRKKGRATKATRARAVHARHIDALRLDSAAGLEAESHPQAQRCTPTQLAKRTTSGPRLLATIQ